MKFNSKELLVAEGFIGFKSIRELIINHTVIPKIRGVYLILNMNSKVNFLRVGTGGHFKGKNPNVLVSELTNNWVNGAIVVYIGKAGSINSNSTLQTRIRQYLNFGVGKNVGHWGGRFIWQMENASNLLICWKPLSDDDPREVEKKLLLSFQIEYSRLPFANLVG